MIMKIHRLTSHILLLATVIWAVGCGPVSNPLKGWTGRSAESGYRLDKAIMDDFENYIQTLPSNERAIADDKYSQMFYEDGTGQHAVEISMPLKGTWWKHVLIYDKNNKRTRVIKYASGRYFP
jgi:hypothetical protein